MYMRFEPDEIIRTKRKTLSLEIKKDGRFVVHAPLRISKAEIDEFIDSKQAWIAKTLEKCSVSVSKVLDVDYSRGSFIPFLGRMIRLDYHDAKSMKLVGADILNCRTFRRPKASPFIFPLPHSAGTGYSWEIHTPENGSLPITAGWPTVGTGISQLPS